MVSLVKSIILIFISNFVNFQKKYFLISFQSLLEKRIMNDYSHYKTLECDPESSFDEIKKNYRKLVLRYHPDKLTCPSTENSEKFEKIKEAWKVLRQPDLRKKYDAECRQAELESSYNYIYAEIEAKDMQSSEENDELRYPCRCGSYYLASREILSEENSEYHFPCMECTFILIVNT